MNVLNHQAAQWAPEDFELPLVPFQQSAPQVLQPVHEPQIRMPPVFVSWESSDRGLPGLGTTLAKHLSHFERFEPDGRRLSLPPLESRFISPSFQNSIPVQLTSPAVHHVHDVSPYEPAFRSPLLSMEHGNMSHGSQFAPQWENIDYTNIWDEEGICHGFKQEQHLEHAQAVFPVESFEFDHLRNPRIHRRSESVAATCPRHLQATIPPASISDSYVLSEPSATAIGQPAVDMPPPPSKRSRKSSGVKSQIEEQYGEDGTRRGIKDIQNQQSTGSKASQAPSAVKQKKSEYGGWYVHGMCGKSFANRNKVKKHHWGNKIGDLNTTTGCWYKKGRPNANWDDHPSCKEAPSRTEELTSAPFKPLQTKSMSVKNKAPTVPTMGSGPRNILPSLPTTQNLSQSARPPHTSPNHMEDVSLPYHTHGFPCGFPSTASSSPFENLLTVVNFAANIESPVPKGRKDSAIFSNLDAEAIAVEHAGQFEHAWTFTSADQASYFDPVFDQHQSRSSASRPSAYDNGTEQE
jgi:hypothetical protein